MKTDNSPHAVGEVAVPGQIVGTMLPDDLQRANEYLYARKHIDSAIELEILDNTVMVDKITEGVNALNQWLTIHTQNMSSDKAKRLSGLLSVDLQTFVTNLYIGTAFCQRAELFTSVTGMLANRLDFSQRVDSIKTIAEVLAVLSTTQVLTLFKVDKSSPLMIQSNVPLSNRLFRYIEHCGYLPPMVCKPEIIEHNYQAAHLTFNESVILRNNHHDNPVSLDVLNIQNAVALELDIDFINAVEEEPKEAPDTPQKTASWVRFKEQSYEVYDLIASQTNHKSPMYITNRFDKRGRMYANGYHINPMGSPYKKASINFANKEYVDVPVEYQTTE